MININYHKMGFEEYLPSKERDIEVDRIGENTVEVEKVTQNHIFDVITSKKPDWQTIIYDLINSEQLDPWDINIIVLTNKYFEKILELEEDPDFYISSKVLLAASLLLRIKSEFLLNRHIKSIDEILFGKKEETKKEIERIEIDDRELPMLIPKTPIPRLKKVTLSELMEALNKAINTESRRIKREVAIKRAHKLSHIDIPKFRRIDIKDRIKEFYARILAALDKNKGKPGIKTKYSILTKNNKEQKLACFLPLLHLSNTKKVWLEQNNHLDDIWIYLYKHFEQNRDKFLEDLEQDIEDMKKELEDEKSENIEREKIGLVKAREKRNEKKRMQEEIKKEFGEELGHELKDIIGGISEIEEQEKIEKNIGFSDEI